jgi:hypothetical protein
MDGNKRGSQPINLFKCKNRINIRYQFFEGFDSKYKVEPDSLKV